VASQYVYFDELEFGDFLLGKPIAENLDFEQKFKYWKVIKNVNGAYAVVSEPKPVFGGTYSLELFCQDVYPISSYMWVQNDFTLPAEVLIHGFEFNAPVRLHITRPGDWFLRKCWISLTVTNLEKDANRFFVEVGIYIVLSQYLKEKTEEPPPKIWAAAEVGGNSDYVVAPAEFIPFREWLTLHFTFNRFTKSVTAEVGVENGVASANLKRYWITCPKTPVCLQLRFINLFRRA